MSEEVVDQQDDGKAGPEAVAALVQGNNAFAFDLARALGAAGTGNLFFSPYSISLALAMTYAGARGETAVQMAETLHFTLPPERLHPAFAALAAELAARGEGARGKDGQGFRLNIANALWGQEGYAYLSAFLAMLAALYGAPLRELDFARAPEASRGTINDWVEVQTEGRITELIPPGLIDSLTRLVLTNAVYFNAAWANPFQPERTADGPFYLLDRGEVTAPLMQQVETFPYAAGQGYQAVELPYDGRELSMLILLPDKGNFAAFAGGLDAAQVTAVLGRLRSQRVDLTLPRFKVESQFDLGATLAGLGMPDAFTDAADFSGMEPRGELSISGVVHKAFVVADDAGTEAAAATAVVMMTRAMLPQEPVVLRVERPFLFLIRDIRSGAILFVGRVLEPGA